MPAVSSPASVLVTGATGFIACHIIQAYLDAGFTVIGTVRKASSGEYLERLFHSERFSVALVEDLEAPGALVALAQQVEVIAHTASPTRPQQSDSPQVVIGPAISLTLNVLRSAATSGSRVKRVVITGSMASVANIETHGSSREYTDEDWNNGAVYDAETLGSAASPLAAYSASKVLAERAAADFVVQNKPSFDVVHVLPYYVYGPVTNDFRGFGTSTGSLRRFWNFFAHPAENADLLACDTGFVDVRDVARTHVDATIRPDFSGARIFCTSHQSLTIQDFYDAFYAIPESERPKLPFEVPRGQPGTGNSVRTNFPTFSRKSQDRLGWELRGLSECVRDTLPTLLAKGAA